MKKWTGLLAVALVGCLAGAALAESAVERRPLMLQGSVVAGNAQAVLAPFGGLLLETPLRAGDLVAEGDTLATLETTKVYAPADGTVGGTWTQAGDDAAQVQERYTALLYLAPTSPFTISTTTKNAYDAADNYYIHTGETVYLRSNTTRRRSGTGFVTSVDGSSFTVEVLDGNLELSESVDIYRSAEYTYQSKIGTGKTGRSADIAITAEEGSVYRLHVKQGDVVKRGDLLLETVTGTLPLGDLPGEEIPAPFDAVVATVDASAGESVSQNGLLATLYPLDGQQVAVSVPESDLPYLRVGDSVRLELANQNQREDFAGTIASISGQHDEVADGEEELDVTYTVYIDFPAQDWIREGMTINAYFNEEGSTGTQASAPAQEDANGGE